MAIQADLKRRNSISIASKRCSKPTRVRQKQRRCEGESGRDARAACSAGERASGAGNRRSPETGRAPEEISAARARVAAADAQIAVLEKALADVEIVAPVAGVVTQKLVDAGEIVMRDTDRRRHGSRQRVGESLRSRADGARA